MTASVGLNFAYLENLTEWLFRKAGIEIGYLVPGKNEPKRPELEGKQALTKNGKNKETVVCEGNDETYTDLVKSLRGGVNLKSLEVTVKSIRKTRGK